MDLGTSGQMSDEDGLDPWKAQPLFDQEVAWHHNHDRVVHFDHNDLFYDGISDLNLIFDPSIDGVEQPRLSPSANSANDSDAIAQETSQSSTDLCRDPVELYSHLLQLYFEKIQPWLPLFHRPKFEEQFAGKLCHSDLATSSSSPESAFVLNAMFALSARYSTSDHFSGLVPITRGKSFLRQAEAILEAHNSNETSGPSLRILQGCIMLACYHLSSGITPRAWLLTGMCSRLAYELGLHRLDRESTKASSCSPEVSSNKWIDNEEKRRAWWSAWELDNFASTISRRPYGFDRDSADIFLPVSDKDWFSGNRVASASLAYEPLAAWQSLVDCPNQSEHAWYLVSLHFIRLGHELQQASHLTRKNLNDFETAVRYFSLALPPSFDNVEGVFGSEPSSGWITCTHILLQK
ncbi:uncharacterized protein A1O5_06643 [Cladophialophora psammophila CBS 110553]|uniref:Xylanolytic transcriptional activator regulatory domain-containing protein n=1 Tax=Cladophialophora psammophila CBS 110553 TaxID=1182543 RepID=W9WRL9_9EURO|nr:uncharacterized protein A1O5_06643 [Cladophialophora psammophila CBS 110553]EXJ70573.1 hypothetical protein A1O5_06643 [Cladophialophora psammophila CBS 110553]